MPRNTIHTENVVVRKKSTNGKLLKPSPRPVSLFVPPSSSPANEQALDALWKSLNDDIQEKPFRKKAHSLSLEENQNATTGRFFKFKRHNFTKYIIH